MNLDLLLPLLATAVVAIVGWFVAHRLSSNRNRDAKRREMRIEYLIGAWRRLENVANRTDNSRIDDLESAIADIQLFGSIRQIRLTHEFMENFAKNNNALLDELLDDLRSDLRNELQLEPSSKKIKHLRIISNPDTHTKK